MVPPQSPQAPPRVAIVTVSYGSADVLPTFLSSLHSASTDAFEVVVADNKPSDGDDIMLLAGRNGAGYLPLPENRGYGSAVNAAIAGLPANVVWVLISNPDVIIGEGAVDVLVATGDADARIACVGPAILTDGVIYPSARAIPSLRTGVGHALFANLWVNNPWTNAYRHDRKEPSPTRRDAGWLSGACLLVRRTAFEKVGGFDTGYFMYFEDVDLGYRLGKAGYRNVYEPAASVTHSGAHSTTTESGRMISAHHASARRFLTKKYSGALLWPVRVALTVGLSLRSALIRRKMNRG
ncbi:MAG: glycosyltransferase family 2 protein [Terrimesophilobacter sp.]